MTGNECHDHMRQDRMLLTEPVERLRQHRRTPTRSRDVMHDHETTDRRPTDGAHRSHLVSQFSGHRWRRNTRRVLTGPGQPLAQVLHRDTKPRLEPIALQLDSQQPLLQIVDLDRRARLPCTQDTRNRDTNRLHDFRVDRHWTEPSLR